MATSSNASDDKTHVPSSNSIQQSSAREVAFVLPVRRVAVGLMSAIAVSTLSAVSLGVPMDENGNGFVGLEDFAKFNLCWADSGPMHTPDNPECIAVFDTDADNDVDLIDLAAFQRARGHLPIPLRDTFGNVIAAGSTTPYSGQKTCGANACHDIARITNGIKFQEGRTDSHGNIIMREDYYGDGRYWIRGGGRYGRSIPNSSANILSPKQGTLGSDMDLTTFGWIGGCGGCHTGGGPGEFDRDGLRLYDPPTGRFGYELLGKTPEDVALDGDYTDMDPAGNLSLARWDLTGLAEPDCLYCHTSDPRWATLGLPYNRNAWTRLDWRKAILAAKTNLVDNSGNRVPAFAAVGPGGQGWFSKLQIQGSTAKVLQIDYSVGVNLGQLSQAPDGALSLTAMSVDRPPRDVICWPCHDSALRRRGDPWFDKRIVHFARWNKLTDSDPTNDVPLYKSRGCNYCHPGTLDHNFAKGNNRSTIFRDDLDWVNFRSCRDCHLTELPNGQPNPKKHPDAPAVPGQAVIHNLGFVEGENGPMKVLSCPACHIPYPLVSPAISEIQDRSFGGYAPSYPTSAFYSADPLDPTNPDKSRWYAGLGWKKDSDGVYRLFPETQNQNCIWGDWDQKGTPDDRSDDVIAPIAVWRQAQITGGNPLPIVTDDNGDGIPEINRPEEILAYIAAFKNGVDSYGRQIAARPVLLKGLRVWYEDPQAPEGVSSFNPKDYGMAEVEFGPMLALSHGVQPKEFALGYNATDPSLGCRDCHRPDTLDSPVFDRKILLDPWGFDGKPVYTTVRQRTGLNPP